MLRHVAGFELRYQLKTPAFWITCLTFFALAFATVLADSLHIGWGGQVYRNSPFAVALLTLIFAIWSVFILTAFVANVVVRDEETRFGPIIYATRLSTFDYLFGRFGGAFLAGCVAFLSVPLGIAIGSAMPWLDPATVGPFRPGDYLYVYFVLCVPTLFIVGAFLFALATTTRSMFATYIGAVVLVTLYYIGVFYFRRPEFASFAALFDPFSLSTFGSVTRNWTPVERNTMLPPLAGIILQNRLIWLAPAFVLLAVAYRAFLRFRRTPPSTGKSPREASIAEPQRPALGTSSAAPTHRELGWGPLVALTRFDVLTALRSPAYAALLGIAFINAVIGLWIAGEDSVSTILPVTRVMIQALRDQFTTLPMIIAAFYAGELVWRDRERRIFEMIDATPASDAAFLVPKILASTVVLFSAALISVVAAILVQVLKGYTTFEFTHYLSWYVFPWLINMVLYAVLAVFVQALVPNKYLGLLIMLLFIVGQLTLPGLGFEHNLYRYASTPPVPLSDMNGQGPYVRYAAWFQAYWLSVATLLVVGAYAVWRRGVSAPLRVRLKRLPHRIVGPARWIATAAAVATTSLGAFIFYNTNIVNEYRPYDVNEAWAATYEKTMAGLGSKIQPRIRDVTLNIDLFPDEPRVVTRGTYVIENQTTTPMTEVHVSWPHVYEAKTFIGTLTIGELQLRSLEVTGARMTRELPDMNFRIFTFDTPLAPGERREIRFETVREQHGFRNSNNEARVVANGTFLDNLQITPRLGIVHDYFLSGRTTRRKYGLPEAPGAVKLEDSVARADAYLRRDSDWVNADITVSTVADQTVLAPGYLIDTRVAGGRRVAHFRTESPILNFFSIQSAAYAAREDHWKDVPITVYYHPAHAFNVDSMLTVMKASLDYYSQNFSPFQFRQLRLVEFPAYVNFAQSFPGTIAYSEAAGFVFNISDPQKPHLVTYVTAHETAHQWWFHQVVGADMEGMTVLSETLAQYSALMVMERMYGPENIRLFLKSALSGYLRGRGTEAAEERPLERLDGQNQAYIGYQKGALVMYLLKEQMGEAAVNRALQALIHDYAFKGPPYPRSLELVERLRAQARPEEQQLITDLFEKITLYDLQVASARSSRRSDGKWDVVMEVELHKRYADGKGVETEAPLDGMFDVGIFSADPGTNGFTKANVLSMERRRLHSGQQSLTVVVDQPPRFAGLDAYTKYVDRKTSDNVVPVKE